MVFTQIYTENGIDIQPKKKKPFNFIFTNKKHKTQSIFTNTKRTTEIVVKNTNIESVSELTYLIQEDG